MENEYAFLLFHHRQGRLRPFLYLRLCSHWAKIRILGLFYAHCQFVNCKYISQQHCKNEYDHFSHFRSVWQDLRQVKNYTDSTKHPKQTTTTCEQLSSIWKQYKWTANGHSEPQELNPQADHSQVTQFQYHSNKSNQNVEHILARNFNCLANKFYSQESSIVRIISFTLIGSTEEWSTWGVVSSVMMIDWWCEL